MVSVRIALLTNIPSPYRVPVYNAISDELGDDFHVLYMAASESNRQWDLPPISHAHSFASSRVVRVGERHIHFTLPVSAALHRFRPSVVFTTGFNPPMLEAYAYTRARRIAHIAVSDAWLGSERRLSRYHRWIRSRIYPASAGGVGASRKTIEMFRHYGASRNLHIAPLSIDNDRFRSTQPASPRPFDLVFSGGLTPRKNPHFLVELARRLAARRPHKILIIGDGPLRAEMASQLDAIPGVTAQFTGYLTQAALPAAYAQGKVFVFPTHYDAWGLVANEACAAGLPVLVSENAGCADDLVVEGENGHVLPLDVDRWVDAADALLNSDEMWSAMSRRSVERVQSYTHELAARAFIDAAASA